MEFATDWVISSETLGGPPPEGGGEGGDGAAASDASPASKRRRLQGAPGSTAQAAAAPSPEDVGEEARHLAALRRTVERVAGAAAWGLDDRLPPAADSLRAVRLAGALRSDLGLRVSVAELRSGALPIRRLLQDIERQGRGECGAPAGAEPAPRCYRVWSMMWRSQVVWLFQRDRPLAEETLRCALQELARRHAALRVRPSGIEPTRAFRLAERAMARLRVLRRLAPRWLPAGCWGALLRGLAWAVWDAWPRIRVEPPSHPWGSSEQLPLTVLPASSTQADARVKIRSCSHWEPPLQVTLAPYHGGALVRFKVSHMLVDGFSVEPLLSDLSDFVMQAEEGGGGAHSRLLSPPQVFELLEERLRRSIEGDRTLREELFSDYSLVGRPRPRRRSIETRSATLPPCCVALLRDAAERLAISVDTAMVLVISVAAARCLQARTQPICLVAPQRDEAGADEMIGLLADFREFDLCTEGLSFAGAAARLQSIIRDREWHVHRTSVQHLAVWINLEWTVLQGKHGFSQVGNFINRKSTRIDHAVDVVVDEPCADTFRIHISTDSERFFSRQGGCGLGRALEESLRSFVRDPLAAIWEDR